MLFLNFLTKKPTIAFLILLFFSFSAPSASKQSFSPGNIILQPITSLEQEKLTNQNGKQFLLPGGKIYPAKRSKKTAVLPKDFLTQKDLAASQKNTGKNDRGWYIAPTLGKVQTSPMVDEKSVGLTFQYRF